MNYNNYIKNTVVPKYQALGKHVTTVNEYANLLTNPSDLTSIDASLFTDSAHLQPAGYDRLAQTWFTGIEAVVPVPEPSSLSLLAGLGLLLAARACWHVCRQALGLSRVACVKRTEDHTGAFHAPYNYNSQFDKNSITPQDEAAPR